MRLQQIKDVLRANGVAIKDDNKDAFVSVRQEDARGVQITSLYSYRTTSKVRSLLTAFAALYQVRLVHGEVWGQGDGAEFFIQETTEEVRA